jgi:hypothetical protein
MSIDLHYYEKHPAWKIVVPDPERFRGVNYDLEIRLFRMPRSGLVAYWLRLYDDPDQPFFLHRVLDPSDDAIAKYLGAVRDGNKIVLVFESPGEQGSFAVDLPVNGKGLGEVMEMAVNHSKQLGDEAHGEKSVEDFLTIFNAALREKGDVTAAWQAVDEHVKNA